METCNGGSNTVWAAKEGFQEEVTRVVTKDTQVITYGTVLRFQHSIIQNNTLNGVQNTTIPLTEIVMKENHSFLGSYIIKFEEH